MTEADWLASTDPTPMLEFLRGKASDRKLRLFACGCCRRVYHLFDDQRSSNAVDVAEQFADGCATNEELDAVCDAAGDANFDGMDAASVAILVAFDNAFDAA